VTSADTGSRLPLPATPAEERQRLRSELVAVGQEVARYQALIAMLRAELRSLRPHQVKPEAAGYQGMHRRLSRRVRTRMARPIRRLALRFADYTVAHDDGKLLRRMHPWLVRLLATFGRRWPLRRLFPWLAELSFSGGAQHPATTRREDVEKLQHDLRSLRRDLDHTRALAGLLRGEVRLARGHQLARASVPEESPADLVRDGVVVPTDGMVSRLVGRVQIAGTPAVGRVRPRAAKAAQPTVTVAVRFHDMRELPRLERCLYCLQAQRDVDLEVLVMFQGADHHAVTQIETMIERMWLEEKRPRVVSVPDPDQVDFRALLLNRALDIHYGKTSNDFFYVLDHDDIVFSHALATLARPIVGTGAALNFGKVLVARYLSFDGYEFLYRMDDFFKSSRRDLAELMVDNFFPIHAYIFHTRAMPPGYLRFDVSMDRLEDYECLYRVVSAFPASTRSADELVGLYCWRDERGILGPISGSSDRATSTWDRNRESLARTMISVASLPIGGH
jgi:hypothetical protein